jgi:hypothetical protein
LTPQQVKEPSAEQIALAHRIVDEFVAAGFARELCDSVYVPLIKMVTSYDEALVLEIASLKKRLRKALELQRVDFVVEKLV